MTAII